MQLGDAVRAGVRHAGGAFTDEALRDAGRRLVHGPPALQRWDAAAAAGLAVAGAGASRGGATPAFLLACALLLLVRRVPVPVTALLSLLVVVATGLLGSGYYYDQWGSPVEAVEPLTVPAVLLLGTAGLLCGREARLDAWFAVPLLPCLLAPAPARLPLLLALVLGLAVGAGVRSRREEAALRRSVEELERVASAQRTEQIGLEERGQLARELHDIVGHHVTAVVVLAEAAQARGAGESAPDLVRIADTARAALGELDTLVTALRDPSVRAETTTPPSLDDLPELLDPLQHAGITASLAVSTRGELAQGLQLTAFRVVQEALTNVMRHAGARSVRVGVLERDGVLEVRVDDDGCGFDPAAVTRGRGLLGIGERVAGHGGAWAAEASPLGGTRLRAELPLVPAPRPAPVP